MTQVLTPLKTIRAYCLSCCCDDPLEVRECTAEKYNLHPYRLGKTPAGFGRNHGKALQADTLKDVPTAGRSIRLRCVDCVGFEEISKVRDCDRTTCELYAYRMGKAPNRSHWAGRYKKEQQADGISASKTPDV
jgi:hypothetical protein